MAAMACGRPVKNSTAAETGGRKEGGGRIKKRWEERTQIKDASKGRKLRTEKGRR